MRKKLIAAIGVAAAMSVPLAGAAWAEPTAVGAGGQGGESSADAQGPKKDPSGLEGVPFSPGAQGGLTTDLEVIPGLFTVHKDAGTNFAGRTDLTVFGLSGTASGTIRQTKDGVDQQRGHFTGDLFPEPCSGLCP